MIVPFDSFFGDRPPNLQIRPQGDNVQTLLICLFFDYAYNGNVIIFQFVSKKTSVSARGIGSLLSRCCTRKEPKSVSVLHTAQF